MEYNKFLHAYRVVGFEKKKLENKKMSEWEMLLSAVIEWNKSKCVVFSDFQRMQTFRNDLQ